MRVAGVTYIRKKKHNGGIKLIKLIFTFLILAVIVSAAITLTSAWNIIHPSRQIADNAAVASLDFREIKFLDGSEELVLDGWFFEQKDNKDTVILIHGYGQNRLPLGNDTVKLIKSLYDAGYSILTFDLRNSGTSEGRITTFGNLECNDVIGAINYVKTQGAENIFLMGFSTGASTAVPASLQVETGIRALVLDTPYDNLDIYLKAYIVKNSNLPGFPFKWTVPYAIKRLSGTEDLTVDLKEEIQDLKNIPVLFIHSVNDSLLPSDCSIELYNRLTEKGGSGALMNTEAPGHAQSFSANPEKYIREVIVFLEKHRNQ